MSERKIWRLLHVGEKVKACDQIFDTEKNRWTGEVTIDWVLLDLSSPHRRLETIPAWPLPRDTKTDPPTEKDADGGGCVLEWIQMGAFWGRVAWVSVSPFGIWLPLPPAPTPPKSAAEIAWDEHCASTGPNPALNEVARFHFYQGFEAGQKGATK